MIDNREAQLTADIMRRVRFIHGLRMLMSPAMIRAVVFLASVISTIAVVSVPHVIANMSHLAIQAYAPYLANAYLHTTFAVQTGVILALAAGVWLVRDIVRNLRYTRTQPEFSGA
jgi:hypothetical protein